MNHTLLYCFDELIIFSFARGPIAEKHTGIWTSANADLATYDDLEIPEALRNQYYS